MRPLASEHRCGTAATADYIAFHAAERPDAVAIVDRGREITYAQFHRDLGRFVGAVAELGLARGRSVAVAWGELYPHWLLLIACEELGIATASFLFTEGAEDSPLLQTVDLVLSQTRPRDVSPNRHYAVTKDWLAGVFARTDGEMPPVAAKHPDDPLRIVRTSGTTGEPKRLLWTRRMFEAWVERRIWSLGLTRKSRSAVNMPFAAAGCYVLSTAVIRAGGTVLNAWPEIGTPAELAGFTHLRLTPLELQVILDGLPPGFVRPPGLLICTVGAAVAAPLRERTLARLASEVIVSYGCNEVLFAAETRVTGSEGVSTVYPWVEVEVVDDRGMPLPPGTAGKIRLRDAAMATGYLGDPETTARKFRDGWFYPGDIGILHGPRRIQLVGREDELLNIGGIKMAPSTLEALVQQHATVGDIGVCSIGNAEGIEEICVAVVNPSHGEGELMRRVTTAFHDHVIGRRFYVVKLARIPRNANGKIQRDLLKHAVAAATGRKP
jgi:acyl-coenzyme A synthetase/AMP-(fatty) acid ligase